MAAPNVDSTKDGGGYWMPCCGYEGGHRPYRTIGWRRRVKIAVHPCDTCDVCDTLGR